MQENKKSNLLPQISRVSTLLENEDDLRLILTDVPDAESVASSGSSFPSSIKLKFFSRIVFKAIESICEKGIIFHY